MSAFERGVRRALPLCVGMAAVGFSFGLTAAGKGMTAVQAGMMSLIVFAGGAQFFALSLMMPGMVFSVSPLVAVLGVFFINLRHLPMSVHVNHRLKDTPVSRKLVLFYALCDESYVLFSQTPRQADDETYLAGIQTALVSAWALSTFAGALAVSLVPAGAVEPLGIAIYAAFVSMLVPAMAQSLRIVAVVLFTLALNTMLERLIPVQGLNVVMSMLLGALFGALLPEEKKPAPPARKARRGKA